jgi:hypothetical protein
MAKWRDRCETRAERGGHPATRRQAPGDAGEDRAGDGWPGRSRSAARAQSINQTDIRALVGSNRTLHPQTPLGRIRTGLGGIRRCSQQPSRFADGRGDDGTADGSYGLARSPPALAPMARHDLAPQNGLDTLRS